MSNCPNCNADIDDKVKFCENCGEFIELFGKEIKYNDKKSLNDFNNLKKIIIETLKIPHDDRVNLKFNYENIIFYLLELTNIKNIFNNQGIDYLEIKDILKSLNDCSEEAILYEFLLEVNNYYISQKKSIQKKYFNAIVYTNISDELLHNQNFKDILSFFNLDIFDFKEYNFKNYENEIGEYIDSDFYKNNPDIIKKEFDLNCIMFKYTEKVRDTNYIKYKALEEVYSFFGYLTFIEKFDRVLTKFHINDLALNNQISDLECNAVIITNQNNEIVNLYAQHKIIISANKIEKSNWNDDNNFLIKNFNLKDKNKISKYIKEYFYLFYLASTEKMLGNSFIKFWSLSEKILKDICGDMNDNQLRKFMANILKGFNNFESMIDKIDVIYKKRNSLVHENKHGDITQYDRILVKTIAEELICFLIKYLDDVNEIREYGIILDYHHKNDDYKRRVIELINLTIN